MFNARRISLSLAIFAVMSLPAIAVQSLNQPFDVAPGGVLALHSAPVQHAPTPAPSPLDQVFNLLFGSTGSLAMAGYSNFKTGRGASIPMQGNAPDINAIMGGWVDRGIWPYYDTLKLQPGSTVSNSYEFFATPKGAADPYLGSGAAPKTYVETNMLTANQFNPPRDLILKSLGFYILTDARLYDINQVFKFSYFEFKIDEKVFFQGPMVFHPAGMGVYGVSTQTAESAYSNGLTNPYATRRFGDFAKYIAPLMRFSLSLYFPETINQATNSTLSASQTAAGQSGGSLPTLLSTNQGGNGIWLMAVLDGLSDRSVQ